VTTKVKVLKSSQEPAAVSKQAKSKVRKQSQNYYGLMAEYEQQFWSQLVASINGDKEAKPFFASIEVTVPVSVSLYKLAQKVEIESRAFDVLNDLFFGYGYQYVEDYPDKDKLAAEDALENGWIAVLMSRFDSSHK